MPNNKNTKKVELDEKETVTPDAPVGDTDGDSNALPATADSDALKEKILNELRQREQAIRQLSAENYTLREQIGKLLDERTSVFQRLTSALRAVDELSKLANSATSETLVSVSADAKEYNRQLRAMNERNQNGG